MKVECQLLSGMHLDPGYALLSVQNCFTCMEMFNVLDVDRSERLNDVQFLLLMRNITDLGRYDIEKVFNLLDIDHSGEIEFDEFYLIFCILIASKDSYEKEFIYRHSKSIFQLIDSDGSGEISSEEFSQMGILFNFDKSAIKRIFVEFDVSGDRNLDFAEFRLFTMACIDEARAQAARSKVKAYENFHDRLLKALEPLLRRFIRTDTLPVPRDVEETTARTRPPFVPGKSDWRLPFKANIMQHRFRSRREKIREYVKHTFGKWRCLFQVFWLCCCDFCCLTHPEDRVHCEFKVKCTCKCLLCWNFFLKRYLGCCECCCHCCPCIIADERRQRMKCRANPADTSSGLKPLSVLKKKEKQKRKKHSRHMKRVARQSKKSKNKNFRFNKNGPTGIKREKRKNRWCYIL